MREKLVAPIEWTFDKVCALTGHSFGTCFVMNTYYNSWLAHWAYRWLK